MSIRGTFMCAAGAFLVTAVLFAAAMVITQRVFTAEPVDQLVPNTGDNPVGAAASEPVTNDIALTTDRDVSTPQTLDDSTAAETTTPPSDEPASAPNQPASAPDEPEDDAPPADTPAGDGAGHRNSTPASSKDDARKKQPDTAQAPPDTNPGSKKDDTDAGSQNDADAGSGKKPEPSQPRHPVQTPTPSPPQPTKPQTQTSSLVTEPSTEQRDDTDRRDYRYDRDRDGWDDRDRDGWDAFRRRDDDRSWWDFFSRRDDHSWWDRSR